NGRGGKGRDVLPAPDRARWPQGLPAREADHRGREPEDRMVFVLDGREVVIDPWSDKVKRPDLDGLAGNPEPEVLFQNRCRWNEFVVNGPRYGRRPDLDGKDEREFLVNVEGRPLVLGPPEVRKLEVAGWDGDGRVLPRLVFDVEGRNGWRNEILVS